MKFDSQHTFFLTVGIGIITYSIPFIWNAYQEIISLKKKEVKNDIDGILKDETYSKSLLAFERIIQYPVGVLVFSLLVALPFFSFGYGLIFLTLTFIYFLLMPAIFNKIIKKYSLTNKRLLELISKNKLDFEKNEKIFRELWDYGDVDLEKHFNTDFRTIFIVFSKEMDGLIESGYRKDKYVVELLSDYEKYLSKRNIIYLVVYDEVFPKILEWHYKIWKEEYNILGKNETEIWWYYNEISDKLDAIIRATLERSLAERHMFSFFDRLKKHVEKYKNEKIDEHSYLENLPIYQEFFEKLKESSESYDIVNHYFPEKWKIKSESWNEDNLPPIVWWVKYFQWAHSRIDISDKTDNDLDAVTECLIPNVEPGAWAIILTFVCRSWGGSAFGDRIKTLIEYDNNFGHGSRMISIALATDEEMFKDFDEKQNEGEDEAVKLASILLYDRFRDVDKHIKELELQKNNYAGKSFEKNRAEYILKIFKKIEQFKKRK